MVSAFIQIQHASADLKQTLSQMAKSLIIDNKLSEAKGVLDAILSIDPNNQNALLVYKTYFFQASEELFVKGKGNEGRAILKEGLVLFPDDKDIKLKYLQSFIEKKHTLDALKLLKMEEPRVAELPAYYGVVTAIGQDDALSAQIDQKSRSYPEYHPGNEHQRLFDRHQRETSRLQNQRHLNIIKLSAAWEQLKSEIASLLNAPPRTEK